MNRRLQPPEPGPQCVENGKWVYGLPDILSRLAKRRKVSNEDCPRPVPFEDINLIP